MKFAYVVSPDAPDIDLEAVVTAIQNMEKSGAVEIVKLTPKPEAKKKR
jgi:translation elongation factor EF-1beta